MNLKYQKLDKNSEGETTAIYMTPEQFWGQFKVDKFMLPSSDWEDGITSKYKDIPVFISREYKN